MAGEAFGLGRLFGQGGQQYDEKFALAFPESFDDPPDDVRTAYQSSLLATKLEGLPPLQRYAGATVMPCSKCQTPLHVGPRVRQMMAEDPQIKTICPLCYVQNYGDQTAEFHHLGNTGESRTFEVLGVDDELAQHVVDKQVRPQLDARKLGADVAFVNTSPTANGYKVRCIRCGRQSTLPFDPGNKVVMCPDCARRQARSR